MTLDNAKSTRREFLRGVAKVGASAMAMAASGASGLTVAGNHEPQRRPNVLLLFPDQWRFDWTSANRNLPIKLPNLDRLAKAGTRFTNMMVASPLCAPSRACLASGTEYGKTGVLTNGFDYPIGQHPTFYSMLRQSSYHVLGCGKMDLAKASNWWGIDGKWRLSSWGFSTGINNAGKFDQIIGYELNDNKPADPYMHFLESEGLAQAHLRDLRERWQGGYAVTHPTPLTDEAYCDNWVAENGLRLLDQAPREKPWFLQVNWAGPHNPEDITARMETGVRQLDMPAVNGSNQYSAATNRAIRQNYTAMCENIDRTIGLYLDKLEKTGQLANTIVIFSSDHGEMLGDQGRWGKIVPYHPSACVPLIAAGPKIQSGETSAALISHIDLAATILDYAGVAIPATMDGRSIRPVLEGKRTTHRECLFSGLGAWRMAFDGEWKAISGFDAKRAHNDPGWSACSPQIAGVGPMMFDLGNDPGENRNVAGTMPARGKQLLDMLADRAARSRTAEDSL